jgi:hypothetical protein
LETFGNKTVEVKGGKLERVLMELETENPVRYSYGMFGMEFSYGTFGMRFEISIATKIEMGIQPKVEVKGGKLERVLMELETENPVRYSYGMFGMEFPLRNVRYEIWNFNGYKN